MSATHVSLDEFIENFEWDSEAQRKGFLSFIMDFRNKMMNDIADISPNDLLERTLMFMACWFIQKDHDSNEWYNERFGDLDKKLTDEIIHLRSENQRLSEFHSDRDKFIMNIAANVEYLMQELLPKETASCEKSAKEL